MILIAKLIRDGGGLYRVSQKNALLECCWSHSALAQSQVAGTPCVWKLIFWSFLTKTKPDQAFPSHVHGKIRPTALNIGYDFVLLVHFLGHPGGLQ